MAPDGLARVHPRARAFDAAAGAYERARPDYPEAAVRAFRTALGIGPDSVVLDLAAGTGKLTRSLRAAGPIRLLAVEPSEGMRREFLAAVPDVPILDGTAERIPIADGRVDAVVVGQAFHWFGPEAPAEIARVLRPGGGLAVFWNVRDETVPWVERFGALVYDGGRGRDISHRDGAWRTRIEASGAFGPLGSATFRWRQPLVPEDLVVRALSTSYVAALDADGQRRVTEGVRALLRDTPELSGRTTIELPYVSELHWAFRR